MSGVNGFGLYIGGKLPTINNNYTIPWSTSRLVGDYHLSGVNCFSLYIWWFWPVEGKKIFFSSVISMGFKYSSNDPKIISILPCFSGGRYQICSLLRSETHLSNLFRDESSCLFVAHSKSKENSIAYLSSQIRLFLGTCLRLTIPSSSKTSAPSQLNQA